MSTYIVKRSFTTYGFVKVEAGSKREAREMASDIDGGDFITIDPAEEGKSKIVSIEKETITKQ
jgi:hypothetical protein